MADSKIEFLRSIAKITYITYHAYEAYKSLEHMKMPTCDYVQGKITRICQKMKAHKAHNFREVSRMSMESYNILLTLLYQKLENQKLCSSFYSGIDEQTSLDLTLLYLAHGYNFSVLARTYNLTEIIVELTVQNTINIICSELHQSEILCRDWMDKAKAVKGEMGLSQCLGSIDKPSLQINGGRTPSPSILLACDMDLYFTIFMTSTDLEGLWPVLNLPQIPNQQSYYFASDHANFCHPRVITPYSHEKLRSRQLVFNKLLSSMNNKMHQAKRLLTKRWKLIKNWNLRCSPQRVEKTLTAIILLHNFLILLEDKHYLSTYNSQDKNCRFNNNNNDNYDIHPIAIRLRDTLTKQLTLE